MGSGRARAGMFLRCSESKPALVVPYEYFVRIRALLTWRLLRAAGSSSVARRIGALGAEEVDVPFQRSTYGARAERDDIALWERAGQPDGRLVPTWSLRVRTDPN